MQSRRARLQAGNWADEVRRARIVQGMTIQAAADRAHVAWGTWARIEAGDPRVVLATLCDVGEAVGLDLVLRAYPGRQPTLRDTGQLELAQELHRQAHASLKAELEMGVGDHGQAIDLVLFGPGEIVAIEIERMAVDFQAQLRRADQKRAALAARHQRPVRLILAIEDSRRNRTALEPHRQLIGAALPAGSREVIGAIRAGSTVGRDGLIWLRRRGRRG
jgi:hypothetical protein